MINIIIRTGEELMKYINKVCKAGEEKRKAKKDKTEQER